MPLRDHFRPPDMRLASWEEVHGFWPGIMAVRLNAILPPQYRSGVKIHLGTLVEVDTDELTPPEYEARIYDESMGRRLVAAVEIVSPQNKERPSSREEFVSKCHAMSSKACVVIVDPVTTRSANLYADLAERIGGKPPATAGEPIYAVSCRSFQPRGRHRVQAWEHALAVGDPLPTLPLWISDTKYVPLELERTYEETYRGLRIA